ncbi:reverse transcriptase [Gossypium australe]|uniref:Reverse transcriptase n=1 Tax=Gossypium australe TaxID=47621 RepID=A0A5B6VXG8_9ROSI|nr:reverse transcriptase [Gossypium australe]
MVHLKDLQQQGLNRLLSDHIPVLLVNGSTDWRPRPSKFVNAWFKKEDCMRLIEREWLGMGCLRGKTAGALKKWNVDYGNILENRIIESEVRIKEIDEVSEKRKLSEMEMEEVK